MAATNSGGQQFKNQQNRMEEGSHFVRGSRDAASGQLRIPSLSLCPELVDGWSADIEHEPNEQTRIGHRESDSKRRTAGCSLMSGMRAAGQWQNWLATRISHRRMKALLG